MVREVYKIRHLYYAATPDATCFDATAVPVPKSLKTDLSDGLMAGSYYLKFISILLVHGHLSTANLMCRGAVRRQISLSIVHF